MQMEIADKRLKEKYVRDNKGRKVVTNIIVSTLSQSITLILGLLLPRLILTSWGSEYNGLINSVTTIMRYLALLEAGMGTATLQALYKSISKEDHQETSTVIVSAQYFYKRAAVIYAAAVIVIALAYPLLLDTEIDYWTIFLVIALQGCAGVISFTFRAAYQQLLNAEGKHYVISIITLLITILTYAAKIISITVFHDILIMQLLGVLIMGIQAIIYTAYFKRKYGWVDKKAKIDMTLLKNRKYYVIQQVAGLVFNSTDTLILSIFCGLKVTSVYTVYNMVYSALNMLIAIVRTSTNFVQGQAYHENKERFSEIYKAYTSLQVSLGSVLSSCGVILIISFIKLYTSGVDDIEYVNYLVPVLFSINIMLDCMRGASLAGANIAGKAHETTWRYIMEAGINLSVSLALVKPLGIVGVLLGTVTSGFWRSIDSIHYFYKNVLLEKPIKEYLFIIVNFALFGLAVIIHFNNIITADSYIQFVIWGIYTFCITLLVYGTVYVIFNRKIIRKYLTRIGK